MPFDLSNVRIGHPGAHNKMAKRVVDKRAECALYTAPAAGASIDGLKETFTITWGTSCVDMPPSQIDIYLTAPNTTATKAIHVWQKVNFAAGTYTDVLKPKWWNSTATVSLQLSFVASGTPLFLSDFPVGPSWSAHYNASSAAAAAAATDTTTPDEVYQTVNNNFDGGGLSKGALAAAVIFPILAVAVALVVYVKFSRKKEAKKRQRWSQAMDKRMSVASKDWVSGGRPSGVGNRNTRASSWYVTHMGQQRPSSTFATESGQAGIGARHGESNVHPSSYGSGPEMGQVRPRALSSLTPSDRISRVSFAGDSRPSMGDSLRPAHSHGTPTRAFHSATSAPDEMEMSPTQTNGPFSLSADEIRAKVAQGQEQGRPSVDGELRNEILQMPAATHLRSGQNGSDDFIVRPDSMALAYGGVDELEPPAAAHSVTSPTGAMPMLAPNSSPDDMMRAYAQARNAGPSPAGAQGMRTLYAPSNADGLTPASAVGAEDKNPYRKSVNSEVSQYSDVGKAS